MEKLNMTRRNFLAATGILTAGIIAFPRELFAHNTSPVITIKNAAGKSPVSITKLKGGISMIEGSGGNIGVFAGSNGKLMVDAGIEVSKDKIRKAMAELSSKPLKYLINTHWHFDHESGNSWVHQDGATIIAQEKSKANLMKTIRVEDWDYTFKPLPQGGIPTILFKDEHHLKFNNEDILMNYYGPAHTDCDISVYFPHADVIHVADTFWNGYYPFIDYSSGGTIKGTIAAAVSNVKKIGSKTIVIPGHGPVGDREQLIQFSDMLQEVYHKVATLKAQGKSLKEVVASKPTSRYDPKFGNFVIKGDTFAYLVYKGA
ncbi:MBL fold metallo-hydrolase [Pedobacter sp. Leaf194]|uniref:MBL fold metallo-hydrolase n=1 Tax=Pedobacter sp. Leaf194 TaxID=1736297 RepID=UPI000703A8BC|nr:MBL fold metallo-hydrolase [Pedobacter sp. Leaf194]KQS36215.1 cyclase [Pedobacter sp. Leaf194]